MNNKPWFLVSVLASSLILSSCSDDSDQSAAGRMTLNVTDAPVDEADAVVVQFTSVTLKSDGNEDEVFTFDPPKTIDLLSLQGLVSQPLIEDEEIPAGSYTQIRLGVNAEFDSEMDSYITIAGTDYELRVPSGSQSGLKLNIPFTIENEDNPDSDLNSVYTIDFDLRKSIVNPGGQPGYFLKPVLRLVQNVNTGSISGRIDPSLTEGINCSDTDPLTGNAVYLFEDSQTPDDFTSSDVDDNDVDPLTTALVNFDELSGTYSYEIGYLAEGSFTVTFTCAADLDDEQDNSEVIFDVIDEVEVMAGENTDHPLLGS